MRESVFLSSLFEIFNNFHYQKYSHLLISNSGVNKWYQSGVLFNMSVCDCRRVDLKPESNRIENSMLKVLLSKVREFLDIPMEGFISSITPSCAHIFFCFFFIRFLFQNWTEQFQIESNSPIYSLESFNFFIASVQSCFAKCPIAQQEQGERNNFHFLVFFQQFVSSWLHF